MDGFLIVVRSYLTDFTPSVHLSHGVFLSLFHVFTFGSVSQRLQRDGEASHEDSVGVFSIHKMPNIVRHALGFRNYVSDS